MNVAVSAPGKVHLMGEHAVVYGKPALLAAVNLRLTAVAQSGGEPGTVTVNAPEDHSYVEHAVRITDRHLEIMKPPGIRIAVKSDIPIGYHLGSSAATAVAAVAATMYLRKRIFDPERINRIAYEVEKQKHGNPSGGDNTAVSFGGLLWYRKEFESLRTMWRLPYRIPKRMDSFYLIDTGRPGESTGDMVSLVARGYSSHPRAYERAFSGIESAARKLGCALKDNDASALIDAIRSGERQLERIDVVPKKARSIIRKIERTGGAAKILGGGGVSGGAGYLLAYHADADVLKMIAGEASGSCMRITLGGEGVRMEGGTDDRQ